MGMVGWFGFNGVFANLAKPDIAVLVNRGSGSGCGTQMIYEGIGSITNFEGRVWNE